MTTIRAMVTLETDITPEVAGHVLAHYAAGGIQAGTFTSELIAVMDRADPDNLMRLALAFPAYALAVSMAKNTPDGINELQAEFAKMLQGADHAE